MSLTAHDLATNMEGFTLPDTVVTRADAARLWRELELVENDVHAQAIRGQALDLSGVSARLAELAETNGSDLAKPEDRKMLATKLKQLKDGSPVVHITFAEEPRPEVMQKFTGWVRQNLHPAALMHIGLQPSLVAGCVVRTPSHVYDFSIRAILDRKKSILVRELMGSLGQAPAVAAPAAASVAPAPEAPQEAAQ